MDWRDGVGNELVGVNDEVVVVKKDTPRCTRQTRWSCDSSNSNRDHEWVENGIINENGGGAKGKQDLVIKDGCRRCDQE